MIDQVLTEMITYDAGDPKRIQHFLKVYAFAKLIGEGENLDLATRQVIEIAAVVHDIGIKNSEAKYHSSAGKYQELEGPPLAKAMLFKLGYDTELVERVAWLVGHHHSYSNIQSMDHQILVEADFLVNVFEEALPEPSLRSVYRKIFKTKTGAWLFQTLYLNESREL